MRRKMLHYIHNFQMTFICFVLSIANDLEMLSKITNIRCTFCVISAHFNYLSLWIHASIVKFHENKTTLQYSFWDKLKQLIRDYNVLWNWHLWTQFFIRKRTFLFVQIHIPFHLIYCIKWLANDFQITLCYSFAIQLFH